ncbi:hypothetical protein COMA1_11736 [Candidatus Nitrospira nitrosa]|uniref:Uncharacterized protein n=1 Tax=Candidatus Nitrospira nitrosa TaxID=1742972 RepID=A0A0S4LH94_9BACT|nr:hypothetical protein COMA1_11736 [Candidatus Nitrospira nitrosa]
MESGYRNSCTARVYVMIHETYISQVWDSGATHEATAKGSVCRGRYSGNGSLECAVE